jgi:hypothetical protein
MKAKTGFLGVPLALAMLGTTSAFAQGAPPRISKPAERVRYTNQHPAVIPAWIAGIQGPGRHFYHHVPGFSVPPCPRIESGAGSGGTTRCVSRHG